MDKLNEQEKKLLLRLSTPQKIQDYLDSIPFNHEEDGETCYSPRQVMINKKAHCLEGAMFASVALALQHEKPQILSLKVLGQDYDHVIALYRKNGYWGAISKTNHAVLGFRDPIYKTIRELALSYFHEYFLIKNGEKTLRGYSSPINMNRFGTLWVTKNENLFFIAETIADMQHISIIPKENESYIRKATTLERESASLSHDGK